MIANMVDSILDGDNDTSFPMNDLDIETILMHFEEQNNKCANCTVNCGNSINCNS
jgi:aldehyde:ferredoxin oxidoreductase